jgi:hypothetical protein
MHQDKLTQWFVNLCACSWPTSSCRGAVVVKSFRTLPTDNRGQNEPPFCPRPIARSPRELQPPSDSRDKMIPFCPTQSSFGHGGHDQSRREPKSCRELAENTRGQKAKNLEPQRCCSQSVHPPDSQKDTKHQSAARKFVVRHQELPNVPFAP